MELEKTSKGQMETNIDPCLQEDESTAGPIEELVDVQVDPNEPSRVIKIVKGLNKELGQQPRRICMDACRHDRDSPQDHVSSVKH